MDYLTKVKKLIRAHNMVLRYNDAINRKNDINDFPEESRARIEIAWVQREQAKHEWLDTMFACMMDDFDPPPAKNTPEYEALKAELETTYNKETVPWLGLFEPGEPPVFSDSMVCIIVAVSIMSNHRVQLDPRRYKRFSEFTNRYQNLILEL